MGISTARSLYRKYGAVIIFPTLTLTLIFADLRRTHNWKKSQTVQN
jgi:hypothetical protein